MHHSRRIAILLLSCAALTLSACASHSRVSAYERDSVYSTSYGGPLEQDNYYAADEEESFGEAIASAAITGFLEALFGIDDDCDDE